MIVGGCSLTLYLHGNNSLKGKRSVVSSIKSRVKNKFNIAIAEVGEQGDHRRIVIGISTVSGDRNKVLEVLDHAVNFIEDMHVAELLESRTEVY